QLQPCTVTSCFVTATTSAEAAAFSTFMRASAATAAPANHSSPVTTKHKRATKLSAGGLVADVSDGKSQQTALARVGMPVYYPRLIVPNSSYCSSLTGV